MTELQFTPTPRSPDAADFARMRAEIDKQLECFMWCVETPLGVELATYGEAVRYADAGCPIWLIEADADVQAAQRNIR